MDKLLNDIEIRVLAALTEKEVTTPDYYPLSFNALQAACNQKSNREPVMNCSEDDITEALDSLKEKHFVWRITSTGGRVPKYEHNLRSIYPLDEAETAVLCTLMLRGSQTVGEIRTRSERMYQFSSIEKVVDSLHVLLKRDQPLVMELERIPGHKENRWVHLLGGDQSFNMSTQNLQLETTSSQSPNYNERITVLEGQLEQIRNEFISLKDDFESFKKQF